MRSAISALAYIITGFVAGAVFFIAVSLVLAWTGPTSGPPNGNVAAPINVGATDQIKNAGLGINSLAVFGNAILSGTSRYLNFGSTAGSSGYGFRDNAGTMEFRNGAGNWSAIASTQTSVDTRALAKAWANFNGKTGAIRAAYNIASVTPINYAGLGTCLLHVTFSSPMPDANYAIFALRQYTSANAPTAALYASNAFVGYPGGQTASDFYLYTGSGNGCDSSDTVNVVVFGD